MNERLQENAVKVNLRPGPHAEWDAALSVYPFNCPFHTSRVSNVAVDPCARPEHGNSARRRARKDHGGRHREERERRRRYWASP